MMYGNMPIDQYYRALFLVNQYRNMSIEDIYSLYPFELEIYSLLIDEDNKRREDEQKKAEMENSINMY